nr:pentatricopeptide repeat-containing protein, mitochondrial [Quercus suber]
MSYARQLFDEMHKPRTFLWNTLIKGYVKNELPIEAASVYRQMHLIGVRPDSFTYPFVVKACAQLPELWTGGAVHVHVMKYGLEFVSMASLGTGVPSEMMSSIEVSWTNDPIQSEILFF